MQDTTIPVALNSYSFILEGPARDFIQRFAKLGFRAFELMIYPGHCWPKQIDRQQRRELRGWLAGEGLSIVSLNPPSLDINLASVTEEMRAMSTDIYAATIRLAAEMGCPGVVLTPGKASPLFPAPLEEMKGFLFEAFDTLIPLAANEGVSCYLENVPIGILPRVKDVVEALDQYGDERVGVVYDVANGAFVGEDVAAALSDAKDRLRAVHFSDTRSDVWQHAAVGSGIVPFADVVATLAEIGFDSLPILEIATRSAQKDIIASVEELVRFGAGRTGKAS